MHVLSRPVLPDNDHSPLLTRTMDWLFYCRWQSVPRFELFRRVSERPWLSYASTQIYETP
jgi:hypothetical protein